MEAVQGFAANGGLVLGICNGFQILCEAGLLPGALIRNRSLQFRCEHIFLKTVAADSPFTNRIPADKLLRLPIAHGEGCYFADEETLAGLKANNQMLWQYVRCHGKPPRPPIPTVRSTTSPASATRGRNVAGLMPHPERASEPILGSADGRMIFESMIHALAGKPRRRRHELASLASLEFATLFLLFR